MTSPAPRTRTRNPTPAAQAPYPTPRMIELAITHYTENKAANSAKGKSEKARKALYTSMVEARDEGRNDINFEFALPVEGKTPATLVAQVSTPEGTEIDPRKLWMFLGCEGSGKTGQEAREKFFEIISISKTAVIEHLGTAAATRCERPCKGTENVRVNPKQD